MITLIGTEVKKNYLNSKLKIFHLQKTKQYAIVNPKLTKILKEENLRVD